MAAIGCLRLSSFALGSIPRQYLYGGRARPISWLARQPVGTMDAAALTTSYDFVGSPIHEIADTGLTKISLLKHPFSIGKHAAFRRHDCSRAELCSWPNSGRSVKSAERFCAAHLVLQAALHHVAAASRRGRAHAPCAVRTCAVASTTWEPKSELNEMIRH